jgi:hypothetical protein
MEENMKNWKQRSVIGIAAKAVLITTLALYLPLAGCNNGTSSGGGGGGGSTGGGSNGGGSNGGGSGSCWIAVPNNPIGSEIMSIAYGNNKFVAVSGAYNSTVNKIGYSSDGRTWTATNNSYTGTSNAVAYGGGRFVAGGRYSDTFTSTDGITWATTSNNAGIGEITEIAYGGPAGQEKFVAISRNNGGAAYSSNGENWTKITGSLLTSCRSIAWCNDKFVAEYDSTKIAYSSNGVTWATVSAPDGTFGTADSLAYIQSFAYGDGKYVATAAISGKMAYSQNGISWTLAADSPFNYPYISGDANFNMINMIYATTLAISYGNGKFVAANWAGKTAVSTDGSTWTVVCDDPMFGMTAMAFGNGLFVAGHGKFAYWDGQ